MLDAQADEVTEENYLQPYNNEEMRLQRKQYVDLSLEMKQITDEENEMKELFKERKAPVKKCLDTVLANIKQGASMSRANSIRLSTKRNVPLASITKKASLSISVRHCLASLTHRLSSPTSEFPDRKQEPMTTNK